MREIGQSEILRSKLGDSSGGAEQSVDQTLVDSLRHFKEDLDRLVRGNRAISPSEGARRLTGYASQIEATTLQRDFALLEQLRFYFEGAERSVQQDDREEKLLSDEERSSIE